MQFKKITKMLLSLGLCLTIVVSNTTFVTQARDVVKPATASNDNNTIYIGNDYVSRSFSVVDGKVSTTIIENSRANTTIVPQIGSEDFVINTVQKQDSNPEVDNEENHVIVPTKAIERNKWKAKLTSKNDTEFPAEDVSKLFDGNSSTYIDKYQIAGYPISLKIDLGEVKEV